MYAIEVKYEGGGVHAPPERSGRMKMTLLETLDMIQRGEMPEQYKKRLAKLRKYALERDFLQDAIEALDGGERQERKIKRLERVEQILSELA